MDLFPFHACYPDLDRIRSKDTFFSNVKEKYIEFQKDNYFKELTTKGFFINRIHTPYGSFTGLVGTIPVREYADGNILRHEQTITSKEEKTAQLLLARQANIKPVLLAYPVVVQINRILQSYIKQFPVFYSVHLANTNEIQEYWKIDQPDLLFTLQKLFKEQVSKIYIADGHHRVATMSLLKERFQQQKTSLNFGHILVALFDSNQLKIYPFNRIVQIVDPFSPDSFLKGLSKFATIQLLETPAMPKEKFTFSFFLNKVWYQARWKSSFLSQHYNKSNLLDVQVLNDFILKKILGIKDVRTDKRIIYEEGTSGLRGIEEVVHNNPKAIGFQLFPVQIEDFIKMSDQEQLLPPKSTYFMPRIKNGMVIKKAKFLK